MKNETKKIWFYNEDIDEVELVQYVKRISDEMTCVIRRGRRQYVPNFLLGPSPAFAASRGAKENDRILVRKGNEFIEAEFYGVVVSEVYGETPFVGYPVDMIASTSQGQFKFGYFFKNEMHAGQLCTEHTRMHIRNSFEYTSLVCEPIIEGNEEPVYYAGFRHVRGDKTFMQSLN